MPVQGITETIKSISENTASSQVVEVPTVSTGTMISAILKNPIVIMILLAVIIGIIVVVLNNRNKKDKK